MEARNLAGFTNNHKLDLQIQRNLEFNADGDLDLWRIREDVVTGNFIIERTTPSGDTIALEIDSSGTVLTTSSLFSLIRINTTTPNDTFWEIVENGNNLEFNGYIGGVNQGAYLNIDNTGTVTVDSQLSLVNGNDFDVGNNQVKNVATINQAGDNLTINGDLKVGTNVLNVDNINNRIAINKATSVEGVEMLDTALNFDSVTTSGVYGRIIGALNTLFIQAGASRTAGSSADIFIGDMLRDPNASSRKIMFKDTGAVGIGTSNPSKILDVTSTASGMLPPRMTTTQRDAMTPLAGEFIYNTTTNKHQGYNGTIWNDMY